MPFTPAHIAAVLPFRRTRMLWSALVVGAVAPDLEYFLRMSPQGRYGHTLAGLFVFTLPLGLLTLWLFHAFVKAPFVDLMPDSLARRLASPGDKFRFGGPARFALLIASLLVGISTHLIWDSFTHGNTWPTRHLHALTQQVHLGSVGFVPFYKILQHLSTVVGLAILLVWFAMWYRGSGAGSRDLREPGPQPPDEWPTRKILALAAIASIALLGAFFRALSSIGIPSNHSTLALFVGDFAASVIALLWWQLVALGIWRSGKKRS
ncbi:MAG: DUF4184 family protein [Terriglobales bacterium]|jgi:hypothetical protein